jgi:hypothetical protein
MTENAFIYLDQRRFIVVEIIYPGREREGIPIFPFRDDNCVINLQNNAMVALPV